MRCRLRMDALAKINDIDAALAFNKQWRNIAAKNVDALFNYYRKPDMSQKTQVQT